MNEPDSEIDQQFRDLADAFIDLANQKIKDVQPENVGLAMLYAVSRFNAHVVSINSEGLEEYEKNIDSAAKFFEEKYQGMLRENLDDYKKMFKPDLKYSHLMNKPKPGK